MPLLDLSMPVLDTFRGATQIGRIAMPIKIASLEVEKVREFFRDPWLCAAVILISSGMALAAVTMI